MATAAEPAPTGTHGAAGLLRDRRVVLAFALCAVIAVQFWTGSRYPALNEKALMGGTAMLEDPLGFDAVLPVTASDAFPVRVARSTVNWIMTNRKGMTFGVLLAAGLLTLLRLLGERRFEGSFASSAAGVVLGAPLGVCVNCAAPIARGLHAAGARLETTLAAMISSPTLNVVVLTMLFALFPPYMVAIKLGLALLFLLVGIPLLSRYAFPEATASAAALGRLGERTASGAPLFAPAGPAEPRWLHAALWVARAYASALWFIVRRTVPLMLLAGFLGAAAISVLPWDVTVGLLPHEGAVAVAVAAGALALLGLALPVPIALDMVVCGGLLATGVPPFYVMVLLAGMGVWSVYSFFVVWEGISLRVAVSVSLTLLALCLVAGALAFLHDRRFDVRQERLLAAFVARGPTRAAPERALPEPPDLAALRASALPWSAPAATGDPGVTVRRRAFAPASPPSETLFTRVSGEAVGLVRYDPTPLAYKLTAPYYRNYPIAAGDVHGDGRPDLVLGGTAGLQLFANLDGTTFREQPVEVPELAGRHVGNLALVDLDGDGWLDLFVSLYRGGNHVVFNQGGRFLASGHRELPPTGANLAGALGFGDLDRDGRLDVVLGNWTSGDWTPRPPETSRDAILWNRAEGYALEPLPQEPGETLSVALSDLDGDGDLDVVLGVDFDIADSFLENDGLGHLTPYTREDGRVPITTHSTMSIDVADLNGDLRPDVYEAQITGGSPGQRERISEVPLAETCLEYDDPAWRRRCEERAAILLHALRARRAGDAEDCLPIEDPEARDDCTAFAMLRWTALSRRREGCASIPAAFEPLAFQCEQSFLPPAAPTPPPAGGALAQKRNDNVLLIQGEGGAFTEHGVAMGVDVAGWSWNARFADLDQDEWQDLYVVSGRTQRPERVSNVFYRNQGGETFTDATDAAGLRSHLATSAYVAVDLEGDGDLDLVTVPVDGPLFVYRNGGAAGHAIAFELRDGVGNPTGVGSRVVVHYGPGGERHQMREVKASGGFVSFDPPDVHFGLGTHEAALRVEVVWSTGERSELAGPFAAGHRYRIERASPLRTEEAGGHSAPAPAG